MPSAVKLEHCWARNAHHHSLHPRLQPINQPDIILRRTIYSKSILDHRSQRFQTYLSLPLPRNSSATQSTSPFVSLRIVAGVREPNSAHPCLDTLCASRLLPLVLLSHFAPRCLMRSMLLGSSSSFLVVATPVIGCTLVSQT